MRIVSKMRRFVTSGVVLGMIFGCQDHSDSVSSMVEQARDGGNLKVRQDACSKIAETPGDTAVEALIGLLGDDEHWYCAAHGLGTRREKRAIAPLLAQLEANGPRADKYLWALGEIGDPSVLPQLLEVQRRVDVSTAEGRRVEAEITSAIIKLRRDNPPPGG